MRFVMASVVLLLSSASVECNAQGPIRNFFGSIFGGGQSEYCVPCVDPCTPVCTPVCAPVSEAYDPSPETATQAKLNNIERKLQSIQPVEDTDLNQLRDHIMKIRSILEKDKSILEKQSSTNVRRDLEIVLAALSGEKSTYVSTRSSP